MVADAIIARLRARASVARRTAEAHARSGDRLTALEAATRVGAWELAVADAVAVAAEPRPIEWPGRPSEAQREVDVVEAAEGWSMEGRHV